jgi:hypothetical protein
MYNNIMSYDSIRIYIYIYIYIYIVFFFVHNDIFVKNNEKIENHFTKLKID